MGGKEVEATTKQLVQEVLQEGEERKEAVPTGECEDKKGVLCVCVCVCVCDLPYQEGSCRERDVED